MSESIRIRTTVGDDSDKYLTIKLSQTWDFIKILSLNISQDKAYTTFCSDYGVIAGRITINAGGFGIPNAKVSVFIPIDDADKLDPQIFGLYPFQTVTDTDVNGIRYNLLPKDSDSQDDCYTPIGTFPSKREILDNDDMLSVYNKYYKFTSITNYAGDFMLFGVPVGSYVVHVDADISNIGIASQRPYDLIDQGTPTKFFYSPTKFKQDKNLNSLVQVKTANISVSVQPFWGDMNNCEIGINRLDIDLNYSIRPAAIFMGSLFGDSHKNSVNKSCRPRKNLGVLCEQVPQEGTIEMIRKTIDNQIEQFDIEGGRVIDDNGAWAYQIPMNLDYIVTDEFGNLIPSEDTSKGIPTRARVRFRISMDEGGGVGRIRTRGKYLVPHNPATLNDLDFTFDKSTQDSSFTDIYWNKIYTVKNFISKVEKGGASRKSKTYVGIKNVDDCVGDKTPFPFNRAYTQNNILFTIICFILTLMSDIVSAINSFLCWLRGIKIAGWRPFKNVKPISMNCPTDPETSWTPGCNGQTAKEYTDCISAVLADQLDLFQFDFYNDWVNGTLYYYLLKYKKKRRGTEKFCETNCQDYSGGTGFNPCRNNRLADTTINSISDNMTHDFRNGLMVQYQGTLYYPPILLDGSNMKMFPTDIVGLGAVLDCDWQGFPKIIQYMTESTYKLPPLIQEIPEDGDTDTTVVTGMIEISGLYVGLFFDINCTGVSFDSRQATNMRRLSELGLDIPETDSGATHSTVTVREIFDTTDAVDVATSVNKYVRDSFYQLNINKSDINSYPVVNESDLNNLTLGTSFAITGDISNENHTNGLAYNAFRHMTGVYNPAAPDIGFQASGNSFFMYFGIIPGKTALDKLNSKYFTPCVKAVADDYIIETNVSNVTTNGGSDGSINFIFIGGVAPFAYSWVGTNYSFGPSATTNNGIITGLVEDTYTITATDALGTTVVKEVSVSGPQPLSCAYSIFTQPTTQTSNDGSINILLLDGGTPSYTLSVQGPSSLVTYSNVTRTNSPITGIGAGTYTLTLTDSSSPIQTCIQTITTTAAPALALSIDKDDLSCNSDAGCDGSINPTLSGGVTPYSITVSSSNGYSSTQSYLNASFIGLCQGTYLVVGTDAVGQVASGTTTINQSVPASINLVGLNNAKQCDPTQYTIKFNIVPGTLPLPYTINYVVNGAPLTQIANTSGLNTIVISSLITSNLTISVEDSDGCNSNTLSFLPTDIQRPTSTLSLGGTRVSNTITYNAAGGLSPYTYMPVNAGQINIYTAPNANPVVGVVTDNVGCTATNSF